MCCGELKDPHGPYGEKPVEEDEVVSQCKSKSETSYVCMYVKFISPVGLQATIKGN